MKKRTMIIALVAIVSILNVLSACSKDSNKNNDTPNTDFTETVKKLPVMDIRTASTLFSDTTHYMYDDHNFLVKIIHETDDFDEISYDGNGRPVEMKTYDKGSLYSSTTFVYQGLKVIVTDQEKGGTPYISTLTLDNKGNIIKTENSEGKNCDYSYDSKGNINKINYASTSETNEISFEYADIKSIFRYVNAPNWFVCYLFDFHYSKTGQMPTRQSHTYETYKFSSEFTYTVDVDNYVIGSTYDDGDKSGWHRFEYTPVK